MIPPPSPPWPFTRESLARMAEEGGEKTCPTCGAATQMIVYPTSETNEEGYVRKKWCPSCWETPQWEPYKGPARQMAMEV